MCNGERLYSGEKNKGMKENGGFISISAERIEAEVAFLSTEEFGTDNFEYDEDLNMDYYDDTEGESDVF